MTTFEKSEAMILNFCKDLKKTFANLFLNLHIYYTSTKIALFSFLCGALSGIYNSKEVIL